MNLTPFNFNGVEIRVITDDLGEPWFIAKDVAELLDYADTDKAIRTHCKAPQTYPAEMAGQVRHVKVIPERDLYRLVMRSAMPAAEAFEEWVVGEVLPTIRKTGSYQRPMSPGEQLMAQAQAMITIERQQREHQVALERVERRVDDLSQSRVWSHCPQNCLSLTGVREVMHDRYGLSSAIVDYVLKAWPNQPVAAGMVRNGHEEAQGSQYMVWSKTIVTAAFKRFIDECTMVNATQATHPYFEGRFRLARKVSQ